MSAIAWFELPADDTQRARKFYGDLLGWTFEAFEGVPEYYMAGEAGGAVYQDSGPKAPTIYFGVADIDASVKQVVALGGQSDAAQDIPGVGRFSRCVDTEGNAFALFEPAPRA